MTTVAVIGLSYVGLPLIVGFGKATETIGFDISEHKVASSVEDFTKKLIKGGAFIDVKAMFDAAQLKAAGIGGWRL